MLRLLLFVSLVLIIAPSYADTWITVSGFSRHFDEGNQNERNWGLGFETSISENDKWRLTAGAYRNSNRIDSTYLGVVYYPLYFGNGIRIGAFGGEITGYQIDAIYAILPIFTYEYNNKWGINATVVPTTRNGSGAVGVQFKWNIK